MSDGPEHVAVCDCDWAVSTRVDVARSTVETVAEAHAKRCGPVEIRRVQEADSDIPLAEADGETVATFEGQA